MAETNRNELETAHGLSSHHREMMRGHCGCFHCRKTFDAQIIKEWIDDGETALCPLCGIDSVLPGNHVRIDPEFLEAMHHLWFQTFVVINPPGA